MWILEEICKVLKNFFDTFFYLKSFFEYNFTLLQIFVHPVHTPAVVNYSTFNFDDFSSSLAIILYGVDFMDFIKKAFGL
jgi:hypothetical protein